jgi:ATP-dependent DNA helicase DinG
MSDIPLSAEMQQPLKTKGFSLSIPAIPVVAVNASHAAILTPDGEVKLLNHAQAKTALHGKQVMVCHAPFTRARLQGVDFYAFDILELFAFVHPAKFCVPTPVGLAKILQLDPPSNFEDYPLSLFESAQALLTDLQNEILNVPHSGHTATPISQKPSGEFVSTSPNSVANSTSRSGGEAGYFSSVSTPSTAPIPGEDGLKNSNPNPNQNANHESVSRLNAIEIAEVMGFQGRGWPWTPYIFSSLGKVYDPAGAIMAKTTMHVWRHLPAWAEEAPPPPPAHDPVTGEEARDRLRLLLSASRHPAEPRLQQVEYATRLTAAFAPMQGEGEPHVVLAEAGTGVGKTLGYIAPASVWAEKNGGTVWISTYTRNLQRQIDQELDRLYPDPETKQRKVAIRKGRENYLCLLNLEDMVGASAMAKTPAQAIAAGIMSRWAETTRDGDLSGSDFPGWLPGLLGVANTTGLADKRGECIYSACDHYHKCFVERAIRKSRRATIVVANHALVMIQTALSGPDGDLPQRYVFDEGHHLFDAADSAFSSHLTAWEAADLRRWVLGPEGGTRSRARGLKKRVEDLLSGDTICEEALDAILQAAHSLPSPGWSRRLKEQNPQGTAEQFLSLVHQQVMARAEGRNTPYSIETQTRPLIDGLADVSQQLKTKLRALQRPMMTLAEKLRQRMDDQADTLDSDTKKRLDAVSSSLIRRANVHIASWIAMLETLEQPDQPADFIDWMEIERNSGESSDVGLYRHWVDPMQAFAAALKLQAHGVAITSATLRDSTGDDDQDWRAAIERSGSNLLSDSPQTLSVQSPFDYTNRTRVFIITDVKKDDLSQVAAAYRVLFQAAGGGGLGLFTAINRLRAVYDKISGPLEDSDIQLYAQHVNQIDTGTLVDIFREEHNACLLGTDAVRDGVDVPGDALRLLVYDRVPWPRPTILHKSRKEAFGGRRYDEMSTRLKLRQAFGRLIRRETDRGVFVMLDSMLPSRLHGSFPDGVIIERIGLAEAAEKIKIFLKKSD